MKSFAPSRREVDSTGSVLLFTFIQRLWHSEIERKCDSFIADVMREKLEKWRRMKGRRSCCLEASYVYNRSKSAVSLDVNENNKTFKKR